MSRGETKFPTAAYRMSPTDAAATATDWLATHHMNHVPIASLMTGRSSRPSTAVHATM